LIAANRQFDGHSLTTESANRLDLSGKVILITGAAGGIGAASARALHAAGARVVLTDVTQQSVDEIANQIGGDRVMPLALDVTDRAAADAVVRMVAQRFGGVDVVFANAGIAGDHPTSIAMMDEGAFEKVIEVNFIGAWRSVRACLPQIIERRGHVLMTASIYSYCNGMANAPYAASKAALEMFGRSLRAELAGTGATGRRSLSWLGFDAVVEGRFWRRRACNANAEPGVSAAIQQGGGAGKDRRSCGARHAGPRSANCRAQTLGAGALASGDRRTDFRRHAGSRHRDAFADEGA
jgi:NADP-dependent 3-hydroxy acid dehydrogenase YdfG